MISLVETGLLNALLAVCLASPLLLAGRWMRHPALVHAFWVLVLLKLVAPPLYHVNLGWQIPELKPVPFAYVPAPESVRSWSVQGKLAGDVGQSSAPASVTEVPSRGSTGGMPAVVPVEQETWASWVWTGFCAVLIPVLWVWLAGSVAWFAWQGWRIVRFVQFFLRSAQPAPAALQLQARQLATQMGMKHCPPVWLLPAVVSPMLWSVGGQPRILFPSALLSRLDEFAVATLLTHELAHYRRGDHCVRLLEFIASGVFWWHPLVWVARRELEISEEQCCDAWVVSQFPAFQRRYADALLATVDFLCEDHPPLPAFASGLGDVPLLRERLTLIMCGTAPKSLSRMGQLAVVLGGLLLPVSPSLRAGPEPLLVTVSESPWEHGESSVRSSGASNLESRSLQIGRESRWDAAASKGAGRSAGASDETSTPREFRHFIWGTANSPTGQSRVVAWTNGLVEWQHADDQRVELTAYRIHTILYSPDGEMFLSGCRDGQVRVWDAATCQLLYSLSGHQAAVRALALSPDGSQLATADDQGVVLLWPMNSAADSKVLTRGSVAVGSLSFSADGRMLAAGTGHWWEPETALVQVWDLVTGRLKVALKHESALALVRLAADGQSVCATEWNGTRLTWDLRSATLISRQTVNRFLIPGAVFAPQS